MLNIYEQIQSIRSFEFSFTNNHGEMQSIECSVNFIDKDNIVVIANNHRNKHFVAKSGNEINVYVYTEYGVFTAVSKVINVFEGVINTEYVISHLEQSKHFQRREYFREPIVVDTDITIITKTPATKDYLISTKTRNISGKGISFVSNCQISDFEVIIVELYFAEKIITAMAVPIYNQKIQYYNQTKLIYGFNFIDISQKDTDFIVKKCFLHQLEIRKKHAV